MLYICVVTSLQRPNKRKESNCPTCNIPESGVSTAKTTSVSPTGMGIIGDDNVDDMYVLFGVIPFITMGRRRQSVGILVWRKKKKEKGRDEY